MSFLRQLNNFIFWVFQIYIGSDVGSSIDSLSLATGITNWCDTRSLHFFIIHILFLYWYLAMNCIYYICIPYCISCVWITYWNVKLFLQLPIIIFVMLQLELYVCSMFFNLIYIHMYIYTHIHTTGLPCAYSYHAVRNKDHSDNTTMIHI